MINPQIMQNLKLGFTGTPNETKNIVIQLTGNQFKNVQIMESLAEWLGDKNQTGDVGVAIGTGDSIQAAVKNTYKIR